MYEKLLKAKGFIKRDLLSKVLLIFSIIGLVILIDGKGFIQNVFGGVSYDYNPYIGQYCTPGYDPGYPDGGPGGIPPPGGNPPAGYPSGYPGGYGYDNIIGDTCYVTNGQGTYQCSSLGTIYCGSVTCEAGCVSTGVGCSCDDNGGGGGGGGGAGTFLTQCNNGKDDDGDGKIDYPEDDGCSSERDNTETDGVGDGGDGGDNGDGGSGGQGSFPDTGGHWADSYIETLANYGIVSGYPDGTFKPDNNTNRAEMSKMAVLARQQVAYGEILVATSHLIAQALPFADVDPNAWYYEYVLELYELGVIEGYADGLFRPAQNVSRAEALKIILLTADVNVGNGITNQFSDVPPGSWYMKYIAYAVDNGIVEGYGDGTFKPDQNITRAEITKLIVEIFEL